MNMKKWFLNQVLSDMSEVLTRQEEQLLANSLNACLQKVVILKEEMSVAVADDSNEKYMRLFVASRRLEGMSEKTISQYLFYSKQFFSYIPKQFRDVTTTDIQFFLSDYQRAHNISKRSVDNMRRGINGFFLWLKANDYIEKNPVENIRPIAYDKKPVETLNDDEIVCIRDYTHTDLRTRAIIETLLATGVRVSELVNIKIEDVHVNRSEIVVHCAKKRQKQDRVLFLTAEARKAISDYLSLRAERGWMQSPYLFTANRKGGKQLTERTVNGGLRSIERSLGLTKRLTVHTFRKTMASILYKRGMQPLDIAYVLGHADSRMSETYYISVKQEEVRENYMKYR